jgi:hypothetical protein
MVDLLTFAALSLQFSGLQTQLAEYKAFVAGVNPYGKYFVGRS